MRMSDPVARYLKAIKHPRQVVRDKHARYYGYEIDTGTWSRGTARGLGQPVSTTGSAGRRRSAKGSKEKHMTGRLFFAIAIASLCVAAMPGMAADHGAPNHGAKVTLVYDHALPNVPGKSIKGVLVEYPPGGTSSAHTHPNSAFIYATVLEGAIRSQVNDGPAKVFHKGENFSEKPGDRHAVSANASDTEPAKLLAVFVVDTADKELTMPLPK
jgi:quercetin dioxygenase-like cupin family protein